MSKQKQYSIPFDYKDFNFKSKKEFIDKLTHGNFDKKLFDKDTGISKITERSRRLSAWIRFNLYSNYGIDGCIFWDGL